MKRQHLAQAARAYHAQHGGSPDVVLPAVQGVAQQLRQDLGQGRIPEHAALANAARPQGKPGACRRVFNRLGEQAAQHPSRMQAQRQGARKRPQAGRNQQQ